MITGHIGCGAVGGYEIVKSLRFRASASASMSFTPGVAGNRKQLMRRFRIKRGALGTLQVIHSAGTASIDRFYFNASNQLCLDVLGTARLVTNALFRDPSAHMVDVGFFLDVANGTAALRAGIIVDGVEVSSYATDGRASITNTDTNWNSTVVQYIGRDNAGNYFDGYISEPVGATTVTAYSGFNPDNLRVPVAPVCTYGTNGFYLPLNDGTNLTELCRDRSGNGNHWTASNISLTAGATYDWMDDTPTNNFAVLNPLAKSTPGECGQGNLVYNSAGATFSTVKVSQLPTNKVYAEFVVPATKTWCRFGLVNDAQRIINGSGTEAIGRIGYPGSICYLASDGDIYIDNAVVASGETPATSDIVGLAYDPATGKVWFSLNGVWLNSGNPAAGTGQCATLSTSITWTIALTGAGSQDVFTNFGQRPFAYAPPTGFKALCTKNSPEPLIKNPKLHFDITLDVGNGSTKSITGVKFSPGLVWRKGRGAATYNNHTLYDAVRGATKLLQSNQPAVEATVANSLTAFNADGFSLGSYEDSNTNNNPYVSWLWKAGGAPVTNTDGSISSQVSANPTAGFSVVTYTGTGVDATVGHGLGVAPGMVFYKGLGNQSLSWAVYHRSISPTSFLELNSAGSSLSSATYTVFGTTPTATTSSVLHVGRNNNAKNTNETGYNYVAYCFAEIPGFSRIGSYVGNGSADGPFVNLGFRPAFVMVKRADSTSDWAILDNKRNSANPVGFELDANLSQAEITAGWSYDFVSNGFKYRSATGLNVSGATYIFIAFAEAPFNYANAR